MTDQKPGPDVYWIVADRSNAGKTTISCALIRVLNAAGTPTVGFKPFGGLDLRENLDFILSHYPATSAKLYGTDAVLLSQASPLTSLSMVEVIAPSYRLFNAGEVVLVRKGALLLHNRTFLKPSASSEFYAFDDVRSLEEASGLPFKGASIIGARKPREIDVIEISKVTEAYRYLLQLKPSCVVMEGASGYLPFWRAGPAPRHIFWIRKDDIVLYPHIEAPVHIRRGVGHLWTRRESTPNEKEIQRFVSRRGFLRARLELVRTQERVSYSETLVAGLLKRAALI